MLRENFEKVLIVNLGGVGDLLLSIPALKILKTSFPGSKISVLVASPGYEVAKNLSYIDGVFVFYIGYGRIPFAKIFKNLATLLFLRKQQFNLAINMRSITSRSRALKMKLLFAIMKPGLKAGRDTEGRGDFFDIKVAESDIGKKHELDYNLDTVRLLTGESNVSEAIDLEIVNEDLQRIDDLLGEEGITRQDLLIGVHPGGRPSRRWPLENVCKVIEVLSETIQCKFVITGSRDERDLVRRLIEVTNPGNKIVNLAGKLNVRELAALIKRCRIFISNDTLPMHIAGIIKTPLVAIFGPGDVGHYDPRRISDKAIVIYEKEDCSPCTRIKCRSLRCLKVISPEEVIKATLKLRQNCLD